MGAGGGFGRVRLEQEAGAGRFHLLLPALVSAAAGVRRSGGRGRGLVRGTRVRELGAGEREAIGLCGAGRRELRVLDDVGDRGRLLRSGGRLGFGLLCAVIRRRRGLERDDESDGDEPEHADDDGDDGTGAQGAAPSSTEVEAWIVGGNLGLVGVGHVGGGGHRLEPTASLAALIRWGFSSLLPLSRPGALVRRMRTISWSCWPTRSSAESTRRSTT